MTRFTNLFGTITAILAVVSGIMATVLGCTQDAVTNITVCAVEWLPPQYAVIAGAIFGGLSLISKAMRPGGFLYSLFGSTAVVVPADSSKSTVGTVTPAQVAQP